MSREAYPTGRVLLKGGGAVATPEPRTRPVSVLEEIRSLCREQFARSTCVSAPHEVDRIIALYRADPERWEILCDECVRPAVYQVVQQVLAETRQPPGRLGLRVLAEQLTVGEMHEVIQLYARSDEWVIRVRRWKEHIGSRYKSLLELSRRELAAAIQERSTRLRREAVTIAFLSRIYQMLPPDDEATVGALGEDTVAAVLRSVEESASKLRIHVRSDDSQMGFDS